MKEDRRTENEYPLLLSLRAHDWKWSAELVGTTYEKND